MLQRNLHLATPHSFRILSHETDQSLACLFFVLDVHPAECIGSPSNPSNGVFSCTSPAAVGSVCTATCNTGFDPGSGGLPSATCQANGSYGAVTGTCESSASKFALRLWVDLRGVHGYFELKAANAGVEVEASGIQLQQRHNGVMEHVSSSSAAYSYSYGMPCCSACGAVIGSLSLVNTYQEGLICGQQCTLLSMARASLSALQCSSCTSLHK